jgi:putative transposase
MNFKSKRNPKQICFVNKNALKINRLFVRRIKDKIKFKENIENIKHGTLTVIREKNRYYMCFPMKRDIINNKTPYGSVALDPGVKTFQTFYSEEGLAGKIGDRTSNYLKQKYILEDKLKSKLSTIKTLRKRTRYNIRKRCFLLRSKKHCY